MFQSSFSKANLLRRSLTRDRDRSSLSCSSYLSLLSERNNILWNSDNCDWCWKFVTTTLGALDATDKNFFYRAILDLNSLACASQIKNFRLCQMRHVNTFDHFCCCSPQFSLWISEPPDGSAWFWSISLHDSKRSFETGTFLQQLLQQYASHHDPNPNEHVCSKTTSRSSDDLVTVGFGAARIKERGSTSRLARILQKRSSKGDYNHWWRLSPTTKTGREYTGQLYFEDFDQEWSSGPRK